ncbi:hypothetical protein Tco_0874639 [Tanacetum coccineum]|uniref:Uncharacterized protein n=1 Tax=Tanacetum coccineum TaxID=301880 RepID=A0ABQ5BQV6_9ASTR
MGYACLCLMNQPDLKLWFGLFVQQFKIVEQKVKRTVAVNNDDKNLAFLTTTSPSSTNSINTANTGVSTGNSKVNTASAETSTASLVMPQLMPFCLLNHKESQLSYQRTCGRKIVIDGSSPAGYVKPKGRISTVTKRDIWLENVRVPRAMTTEIGTKGNHQKQMKVQANMALKAFTDS